MIITKGETVYVVEDKGTYWLLKYSIGKVDASIRVDKALAGDFEALSKKVLSDEEL